MLFGKGDPIDAVEQALKQRNWKYEKVNQRMIVTGVATSHGNRYFILIAHNEERRTVLFLFSLVSDEFGNGLLGKVGPGFRGIHESCGFTSDQVCRACEILMHHNYRILLGNFERDARDGEVRYRIAIPYRNSTFTAEQANWAIDVAIPTMDSTYEKVDKFLKGQLSFGQAAGLEEDGGGQLVV